MGKVFKLLTWLNILGGFGTIVGAFVTGNWTLIVTGVISIAQGYAWDLVDELSADVKELKAGNPVALSP
jgi:hypothetical protein